MKANCLIASFQAVKNSYSITVLAETNGLVLGAFLLTNCEHHFIYVLTVVHLSFICSLREQKVT